MKIDHSICTKISPVILVFDSGFWQYKVYADISGGFLESRRQMTRQWVVEKGDFFNAFGIIQ